jgi:hypothetical protein
MAHALVQNCEGMGEVNEFFYEVRLNWMKGFKVKHSLTKYDIA